MIPIKFRARNLETDELITGYGIYADPPAEPDAKGKNKKQCSQIKSDIMKI